MVYFATFPARSCCDLSGIERQHRGFGIAREGYHVMRIASFIRNGAVRPSERDPRIDLLRGLALVMIFCDHIPGNLFSRITLHNFGFADAAEAFVLLAGISSMLAYGSRMDRQGWIARLKRIASRCWRIYLFQISLVAATLLVIGLWARASGLQPMIDKPFLDAPVEGLVHAFVLTAQPTFSDILPLYIVLLALFPVIYLVVRYNPWVALLASGLIWLAAGLDHRLILPKWNDPAGWYFNPFAWQFLFTIGICLARIISANNGHLPARTWLRCACVAYLFFSFMEAAPWEDWGLPNLRLYDIGPLDKSRLAWPRILNISAWAYLLLSAEGLRSWAARPVLSMIGLCGRHSLEVFAAGSMCALAGRLAFRSFGAGPTMQIAVNLIGIGAMICTALWMQRQKVIERIPERGRALAIGAGQAHSSAGHAQAGLR